MRTLPGKLTEKGFGYFCGLNVKSLLPMTESLALDSAMTVGFWIRIDSLKMHTNIVSMSVNNMEIADDNQSQDYWFRPGWSISFDAIREAYEDGVFKGHRAFPVAYMSTDKTPDGAVRIVKGSHYDTDVYMLREPGLWHYVAFTWDGRQYENNAHLYLDGMHLGSATIPGALAHGINPIIVGDWTIEDSYIRDWYLDELQIWNRALSFDEVQELSHHRPVSNEGCVVNLGFDGTLKDLSGNGNDAIAQLNCDMVAYEGLQLPEAKMQLTKDWTGTNVTYTDQTENGEAIYWFYDVVGYEPGVGSSGIAARHAQRQFSMPWEAGVCHPVMVAKGQNACTSITGEVIIGGLSKVEPAVVSQTSGIKLKVYGGYIWNDNLPVRLHKEGESDLDGSWLQPDVDASASSFDKLPYAVFDLTQASTGAWDVIVGEDTLFAGLNVEQYEEPEVWATVSGSNRFLFNKFKDYYLEYGNRSNADAYNTPVYLYLPDDIEVTLGFDLVCYPASLENAEMRQALDEMGDYVVFEAEGYGKMRCYGILIPYIPANSRETKRFYIKANHDVDMFWSIEDPWGPLDYDAEGNPIVVNDGSNAPRRMPADEIDDLINDVKPRRFNNDQVECMMDFIGWGVMDATMSSIPFVGCAYGIGKTVYQGATAKPGERASNIFTNVLSTGFSCLMDFNPAGWAWRATTLASFAFNTAMNVYSAKGCNDKAGDGRKAFAVSSYDPNEMIGPDGFGDNHYMKPAPEMSYTITFENKAEATAPAHDVFINDTLSAESYDFASFGFTSFGWADTTIFVEGQNMKEFVQDVEWKRNGIDIVVRVSGVFDTISGEAKWSFVSLNPETMDYTGEVEEGFLLPNNANHDGEGFVTFGINHKAELGNGARIANKATIIFDANAAIETNNYINTIDTDLPESKAMAVSLVDGELVVEWTASDASSGIASVDLYVSKNDSAFELVAPMLSGNSYKIAYNADTTYCFATIARDNVGWIEFKALSDMECEATYVPAQDGLIIPTDDAMKNAVKELREGRLIIVLPDGRTYNAIGTQIK